MFWVLPSLRFDLQHGSRNGSPDVLYRAVCFWYQAPPVSVSEPSEATPPPEPGAAVGEEAAAGPAGGSDVLVIAAVLIGMAGAAVYWFLRARRR